MGDVKFTRKGQKAIIKREEDFMTEVWLSLWDREKMEGCAALHWGGELLGGHRRWMRN